MQCPVPTRRLPNLPSLGERDRDRQRWEHPEILHPHPSSPIRGACRMDMGGAKNTDMKKPPRKRKTPEDQLMTITSGVTHQNRNRKLRG
jgi:hypothetical protein